MQGSPEEIAAQLLRTTYLDVQTLATAIREAEARGREEAAKAVCPWCKKGWPLQLDYHVEPLSTPLMTQMTVGCKATAIRSLNAPTKGT
jgi:hypothetical protein